MVQSSSTASLSFDRLADNLRTVSKISPNIADNAEIEYGSFQSVPMKMFFLVFFTYDPRNERLDVILGKYVLSKFQNFWHICKAVFVFLHGQGFVQHGFLVKKLTIDGNMSEK